MQIWLSYENKLFPLLIKCQLTYVGFVVLCFLFASFLFASSNALEHTQKNDSDASKTNLEQLKDFALTKINDDRKNFGLAPVFQSNNTAAQAQANELLKTQ